MACNDLLILYDDADCDGASGGDDGGSGDYYDGDYDDDNDEYDGDYDDDGDGDIVVTFWGWHLTSDSCRLPPKITLGDRR